MKNYSKQEVVISSSEDSEIKNIEEKTVFNAIYLPQTTSTVSTIKSFFSDVDPWTKKMYKLMSVWLIVVVFVTISFYVIKAIYV